MSDIKIVIGAEVAAAESGLKKVQAQLANTAVAANKADSAMVKLKGGSNEATFALTNLGRVVQDAPYGFIGIANNINPLLESFQRLKAQTGSTKTAFLSLASSLGGAGGLGLAVSLITSALSFYALYSQRATSETEKAGKAVEITKDSYQKFAEEIDRVAESVAKEASKISVLFEALGDTNISLNQRRSIISQLNELSPKYLENLSAEKSSYEQISTAVSSYIDDLGKSAFIKSFLPQFEEIFKKLIKTQVELRELDLAQKGIFGLTESDYAKERQRLNTQIRLLKQDILVAKKFLIREAGGENSLYEILFGKKPKEDKPVRVPIKVEPVIDPRIYPNSLRNLFKDIEQKEFNSKIVVNVKPQFKTDPAGINKEAIELADQVNAIVKSVFVDAFSGLGEAIGDALSGVSIDGAFSGIVKSLAGGLKAIGQKIIEANVQFAILKKIGFSNPVVGIAVGVAITALGAALQNAVSKQKAFATGVRNFGGGTALVGERGPEMVYLPKGSSVQPNNELNAYGGGQMVFIPDITLRGTDLVIAFNRASDAMGRNN